MTIDGLHISNSPFDIFVEPQSYSAAKSFVTWGAIGEKDADTGETNDQPMHCTVGDSMKALIHLVDEHLNPVVDPLTTCGIVLECAAAGESNAGSRFTAVIHEAEGVHAVEYSPKVAGVYKVCAWVNDIYEKLSPSTVRSLVVSEPIEISADMCIFNIPTSVTCGLPFTVSMSMKPTKSKYDLSANTLSISFRPLSHSLSPRALVRKSLRFDPLQEVVFFLAEDDIESSYSKLVSELTIAGDYIVKLYISTTRVLFESSFYVNHGETSAEFTEIVNTTQFFSAWKGNTEKIFFVQARDAHGNIVIKTNDKIEVYLSRIQGTTLVKDFDISPVGNGLYKCSAELNSSLSESEYTIHVKINASDILYSPFVIEIDRGANNRQISPTEEFGFLDSVALDELSSNSGPPLDYLMQLNKSEITRQRALEVLKRERRKLETEKEAKRRQKLIKRTGGGFLVKFSKDI